MNDVIDPARMSSWFAAHAAGLVLYARHWLPAGQAEDVVQDVFVRLMAQRDEPGSAKAWLYVATRNAAIAAGRSDRRRAARERAVAADRGPPLFQPSVEGRVEAEAAEAALARLPPGQREVVLLRVWGAMTLAEVAQVTGSAVSSVHDQYRGALARLREMLEQPCDSNRTTQPTRTTLRAGR